MNSAPRIQVISSDDNDSSKIQKYAGENAEETTESPELSWNHREELENLSLSSTSQYGFNNLYSALGSQINLIALNLLDIPQLDSSTPASRRELRLQLETMQFDHDHYMYFRRSLLLITADHL
jgi:hypothetical protein